jgi:outer membrane translocation and assembly module TamA
LGTYLHKGFKLRSLKKVLLCSLALFTFSCNTTKNLKEDEYLVSNNKVVDQEKSKVPKDEVEAYIRQKPNRKLLFVFPFNLWLYNQINKEKLVRKKQKRDERFDRINEKRIAKNTARNEKRARKGKPPREPKLKNKDKPTFRESLLDIGEAPVIYDSAIAKQTTLQMKKYLFSKGYFYARVSDSVEYNKERKKAKVSYYIFPGSRYMIHNIKYSFTDEELAYYIFSDTVNTKLKRGAPYDENVMQTERERITTYLLNNGYYYFEQDYIYFDVDSALGNKMVDITVGAKKFPVFANAQKDSITYVKHPRFYVNNIYIITENLKGSYKDEYFKDSIREGDFIFLANHPLNYRRSIITNNIEFFKGQLFQKNLAEKTYKRLLNLRVFRTVVIQFVKDPLYSDQLNCYIICSPLVKQAMSIETEGTNTSGNYGIDGSLLYQNKNLIRGAELLELRMSGAIIAQKQFNTTQQTDINNVSETFNTVQFGPSIRYSVPRVVFPFSIFPFKKDAFPQTYVNTSLNYQSRPEFNRIITDIDYGFSFRSQKSKLKHDLIPMEIYMVKANLTDSFRRGLIRGGDFFLLNSFQDHITTVSKYSITYNNQTITEGSNTSRKPVNYIKVNISSSGNILRGLYDLTGQPKDTAGRYLMFGIPFAQFVKFDFDYRLYIPVRKKSRLVYRTAFGIGKPLQNLNVLPYEQSYFSGGPNGVRAWRARTLGPGGYAQPSDVNARYDKIGDFMIEGNIEYRFHVFRSFYGAIFADGGNIWLLHKDPTKPNGDLEFDRFYKEFAMGGGLGIRWDLSFFVLRLDAAVPLADPSYPEGDRWTLDKQPLKRTTLNFGIGYPF